MTHSELSEYLQKVGLEAGATAVYIALSQTGPASALQLAKSTATSRTQTYRHLESLEQFGLVSREQLSYGTLFRALPIEQLEATFAARESETAALKRDLSHMSDLLTHLAGSSGPQATTLRLPGVAGLKQANWNLTKANGEYRVFEAAHLSDHFDTAFARRCRERYIEQQLTSYDLTNALQVTAKEIEPFAPSRTFIRHLDPAVLTISFEVYIYNQVVSLLDYSQEQPHAIEIHHPMLHQMMHQLFEAMWQLGRPLVVTK